MPTTLRTLPILSTVVQLGRVCEEAAHQALHHGGPVLAAGGDDEVSALAAALSATELLQHIQKIA